MKLPSINDRVNFTEIGDEIVVYVESNREAHCLTQVAKAVFLACKNGESVEDLKNKLDVLGATDNDLQVTLESFESKGICGQQSSKINRREALAATGVLASAVFLASVVAPLPAAAASCKLCEVDGAGLPTNCADCGLDCVSTTGDPCLGDSICCFEYVKRTTNDALVPGTLPAACLARQFTMNIAYDVGSKEGIGQYACRPVKPIFNPNCTTQRNIVANGALYYCCCCDATGDANRNCC